MQVVFPDKKNRELLERYEAIPTPHLLRYSILQKIRRGEDVLADIQGRQHVKDDVVRALLSGSMPYLVSEEGTGKTRLARSVTKLLLPVPRIKGCPYNDDPKWPKSRLCPRCREAEDPVREYGVEWVTGEERFSRIQGNEYTNEAKLLGLKDIQAIARGMSPKNPLAFAGTGVFRANRGILFIDELPAIRTKVQVLLHPIIEEKKAILEEYNWEYPLDLMLIATGNPEGFSHVNEVPRPLLDRLETIYMELPDEQVEFDIMLMERFGKRNGRGEEEMAIEMPTPDEVKRKVLAPWWVLSLINKSVRQSRVCRWLDRRASIRGTVRAIDHTYSSTEIEGRSVTRIGDVGKGLKLALRGRVQLRQDLIDFENPMETLHKVDEVSEDLVRNGLLDLSNEVTYGWRKEEVLKEVEAMTGLESGAWPEFIRNSAVLQERVEEIEKMGNDRYGVKGLMAEDGDTASAAAKQDGVEREYLSAMGEFLVNMAVSRKWIYPSDLDIYIPAEISWGQKASWK